MKLQACPRCRTAATLTSLFDYGGRPPGWLHFGECQRLTCRLTGPHDRSEKQAARKWNQLRWEGPA